MECKMCSRKHVSPTSDKEGIGQEIHEAAYLVPKEKI